MFIIQAKRIVHDPARHDKLTYVYRTTIIIHLTFDEINDIKLQLTHVKIG